MPFSKGLLYCQLGRCRRPLYLYHEPNSKHIDAAIHAIVNRRAQGIYRQQQGAQSITVVAGGRRHTKSASTTTNPNQRTMISRHLLQSCLVAIIIAMVHAGSKTAKQGKGSSSGGGRWSGNNHRPSRWSSPDQWSSPDWSSPDSWSKDYDDEYFDDDDRSGSRLPKCSLANPVEEQYQLIIRSWKLAYLASNANAGTISTYEETVTWHANLVMEAFMKAVEGYEYDGKTCIEGPCSLLHVTHI